MHPQAASLLKDILPESCSIIEQDSKPTPAPQERQAPVTPAVFHGQHTTQVIHKEKPIHRHMAFMVAKGASYKDIAMATGYHYQQVSHIIRQPWMQELVAAMMEKLGVDPVRTMLESAGTDNVMKLIELRDDPNSPKVVQLGATRELFDRAFGKATQHVITERRVSRGDPKDELETLMEEVKEMQKSLPDVQL